MSTDVAATPPPIAATDRLGDEIAELFAHLEAAGAHLLDLIREFDARSGWNEGFRSCAHWLSWRVGMNLGAARERVRVARALGALPRLAEALARGELSYAKVRALTRVATPEIEERLLAIGKAGTACHVEQIVRRPRSATRPSPCTCIRTTTAWSWSAGGSRPRPAPAARRRTRRAVPHRRSAPGCVPKRGR